jgi:hypothetical protein
MKLERDKMTRQATPKEEASARPRRTPLSTRNRLSIRNKEPGYVYRIVNDADGRIEELQERGYEVVPQDKVGPIGDKRVDNPSAPGSSSYISVGQGTKAVVMRIKEEFYAEDVQYKQSLVDDTEQTMKQVAGHKNTDYVPRF